jgi:hypothetical protein
MFMGFIIVNTSYIAMCVDISKRIYDLVTIEVMCVDIVNIIYDLVNTSCIAMCVDISYI